MLLTGKVLVFGDARMRDCLIRVVDHRHRLKLRLINGLVLETQRPIRKTAVAITEVFIDRPAIDQMRILHRLAHIGKIDPQYGIDKRVVEYLFKHVRVAMQRHFLKSVREVTTVRVGTGRYSGGDRPVQLRRVQPPLFAGIATEKLLVQLPTNLTDHNVFGGSYRLDRLGAAGKKRFGFLFIHLQAVQAVERIEVDRNRQQLFVYAGEHTVFVIAPFGKS